MTTNKLRKMLDLIEDYGKICGLQAYELKNDDCTIEFFRKIMDEKSRVFEEIRQLLHEEVK